MAKGCRLNVQRNDQGRTTSKQGQGDDCGRNVGRSSVGGQLPIRLPHSLILQPHFSQHVILRIANQSSAAISVSITAGRASVATGCGVAGSSMGVSEPAHATRDSSIKEQSVATVCFLSMLRFPFTPLGATGVAPRLAPVCNSRPIAHRTRRPAPSPHAGRGRRDPAHWLGRRAALTTVGTRAAGIDAWLPPAQTCRAVRALEFLCIQDRHGERAVPAQQRSGCSMKVGLWHKPPRNKLDIQSIVTLTESLGEFRPGEPSRRILLYTGQSSSNPCQEPNGRPAFHLSRSL